MLGVNRIILVGTVGRDPETRYIGPGASFSRFSVCTTEIVGGAGGSQVEETEWHEVVSWRGLSSYVSQYVKKGDTVEVDGKLKSRYVSRGEGGRRVYEVIASNVRVLARSKANASTPTPAIEKEEAEPAIGSGLPGFDIENIPVNLKGDGDSLPF